MNSVVIECDVADVVRMEIGCDVEGVAVRVGIECDVAVVEVGGVIKVTWQPIARSGGSWGSGSGNGM